MFFKSDISRESRDHRRSHYELGSLHLRLKNIIFWQHVATIFWTHIIVIIFWQHVAVLREGTGSNETDATVSTETEYDNATGKYRFIIFYK